MAKHKLPSYRGSGRIGPLTFALFAAFTAGGIGVAWIYQFLMDWIPRLSIYLAFIGTAAFGGALAAGGYIAVKKGHCRNAAVALALSLVMSGVALAASYYWDWRGALSSIIDKEPATTMAQLKEELPLGKYLELKKQMGWKMSRGGKIDGGMVTVIWIIEGLTVLGIGLLGGLSAARHPYCEKCSQWTDERSFAIHGATAADAEPHLQKGDLVSLIDLPGGQEAATNLTFKVNVCPQCKQTGFLSIDESRTTTDKKGRAREHATHLVKNAVLGVDALAHATDRAQAAVGQKLPA